ncbi:NAD+ diphosphatase [Rubricella aquisinus]|uniref:NAD(+) diphosphatase n=1 Tax=Rubricella aquisinus TaxID=2028108 RepID=A0A840WJM1_9RHOB|nr:NAD(+) diphosphatase [Rubricella aquisinus]MBB5515279.1 NAD+ diphosphatase [Rubricella aquisinus]
MVDPIAFSETSLDRAAHLREPDALARAAADPAARCVPVWRGKPLIETTEEGLRAGWLPMDAEVLREGGEMLFLGLSHGAPRFTVDISAWVDPSLDADAMRAFIDQSINHHPSLPERYGFTALRSAMGGLSGYEAGDLATARAILEWQRTHPHCARCGAKSNVNKGGWQRTCPDCGAHHFPRTDPVVIMLITHGNDVLLGRSPGWPEGMYSLLAGFMEPGETIEAAVRREVVEETQIEVGPVTYLASQPWPFPSSLMIGCKGEALTRDITLDPVEVEDAMWVSKERCMMAMAGHDPDLLPARKGAIARSLLEMWLADEA